MTEATPRDRLIAEAAIAFRQHGYGAANLGAIAAAARISKKTIYKYAESKAALFTLAVEDTIGRAGVGELLIRRREGEAPEATLRRGLIAMTALACSPDGIAAHRFLMHEAQRFPELVVAYGKALEPFMLSLVRFLTEQATAWPGIDAPDYQAMMLVDMVLSQARRQALLGHDPAPAPDQQERLVDAALKVFLHGVNAPPA